MPEVSRGRDGGGMAVMSLALLVGPVTVSFTWRAIWLLAALVHILDE